MLSNNCFGILVISYLWGIFYKHVSVPSIIKGERRKLPIGTESLDFHHQEQTKNYSKVQSWNKVIWFLTRRIIYLLVIVVKLVMVAKFKPFPSLKWNRCGRCKIHSVRWQDSPSELAQLKARDALGEGWTVSFCTGCIHLKGRCYCRWFDLNLPLILSISLGNLC